MKLILITLIAGFLSTAYAEIPFSGTLENRDKSAIYISKKQLNLPESVSKLKTLNQVKGFNSVQVNTSINGNNITGDAANEPSIAVNPLNPNQMAIGWRQFNTINSAFRQAGRSYSTDGGLTWNYQEVFEPGVFRSDPVLAADADGHFYYQSLSVDSNSQGQFTSYHVEQWKSYDGGATWVEKTYAFGGDKSWITIDTSDGTTRGNIYAAWNISGNDYSTRTYNSYDKNTMLFTQPYIIPKSPRFGTLDVNLNGELYIVGLDASGFNKSGNDIYLIKSENPSITHPFFPQITAIDLGGLLRFGSFINPIGLNGQIYVKVDKSNRISKGNVYILASVNNLGADQLDVNFIRSTDGGITFSPPRRINTDNTNDWQWFGTMSVAPNGRIDVIWYDTRNDDGSENPDDTTSRLFFTYSYDAGLSFAKEQAISPRFEQGIGYPSNNKMGDYIDMKSDNSGAHIAYTATFNGEQDVYYLNAKPSTVEENPDFPSLLTNNAWAVSGVPSQGILSSTLINSADSENPLLAFEALFTAKPDGTLMWLVATGKIPKATDSYTVPLYMPTGDLSENGRPTLAIGTMTKRRLRDVNNELIDNKIEYSFDMSDDVIAYLEEIVPSQFDSEFFNNNPFHSIKKSLIFNSLLPREQSRNDLCNINGQVLTSVGEKNEGRLQYTYLFNGKLNLFAADFTYKKTLVNNVEQLDLDNNGLATPTWKVMQSDAMGVQADNSVRNLVSTPNGGLGFFESGTETGVTEIGYEQVSNQGNQLMTSKPNNSSETMNVLANNAYCGDYWK